MPSLEEWRDAFHDSAHRDDRRHWIAEGITKNVGGRLGIMTSNDFRRIALGLQDAVEGAHMGHPDFRVNGRIFATLHADNKAGMVALSPEHQQKFLREHPSIFVPENGAWGRQGCTRVLLNAADEEIVGEAMTCAWQDVVKRGAAGRSRKRS